MADDATHFTISPIQKTIIIFYLLTTYFGLIPLGYSYIRPGPR